MKLFILILLFINIAYSDESYEKAMMYLNGEIGTTSISKTVPRCPYEKCDTSKTYKIVKKDTKEAYRILKKVHKEDLRASMKALTILLKQIDYKSKKYDSYLLKKLEQNYALNEKQYKKDVILFLNALMGSSNKEYLCEAYFLLYKANKNAYFGLEKNLDEAENMRRKALQNCKKTTYKYFILANSNTKVIK